MEYLLLSPDDLRGQVTRHQRPRWDRDTCLAVSGWTPTGRAAQPSFLLLAPGPAALAGGRDRGGRNRGRPVVLTQPPFQGGGIQTQTPAELSALDSPRSAWTKPCRGGSRHRRPPAGRTVEMRRRGPRGRGLLSVLHEATGRPTAPARQTRAPRLPGALCPRPGPGRHPRGPPRGSHRVHGLHGPPVVSSDRSVACPLHGSARPPREVSNVTALFLPLSGLAELGATPSSAGDAVQRGPSPGTAEQATCRLAPATQAPNDQWPPQAGKGSRRGRAEAAVAAGHGGLCRWPARGPLSRELGLLRQQFPPGLSRVQDPGGQEVGRPRPPADAMRAACLPSARVGSGRPRAGGWRADLPEPGGRHPDAPTPAPRCSLAQACSSSEQTRCLLRQ